MNIPSSETTKEKTCFRLFVQSWDDWYTKGLGVRWMAGPQLSPSCVCPSRDAESLLESQPLGSFLIRVSHSHVGYTLSYK